MSLFRVCALQCLPVKSVLKCCCCCFSVCPPSHVPLSVSLPPCLLLTISFLCSIAKLMCLCLGLSLRAPIVNLTVPGPMCIVFCLLPLSCYANCCASMCFTFLTIPFCMYTVSVFPYPLSESLLNFPSVFQVQQLRSIFLV